jgi:hypothetical protein
MLRRFVAIVAITLIWHRMPAAAHSWYPPECCHEIDCAPVEAIVRVVPVGGGAPQLLVRSKHGAAIMPHDFPVRDSQDGHMHVCLGYDPFGSRNVLCFFVPPSM